MAGPGREPDDDRRLGWDSGGLEDGRKPASDGRTRRVLARDAQPAGRPGLTQGDGGRKHQVIDDRFEGA